MKDLRAPNILIVDDTPANLRLLADILEQAGYEVRPAPNGRLALMAAHTAPPDLILLDIRMPEMDGYQVCARLKDDPRTRDIPLIFISALNEVHDKVNAFKAGAVDYIIKPFEVEEVLARVGTHLALRAANLELTRTIQELDASNADLQSFAHTVAHDLKNPLTVVHGYSNLLKDSFLDLDPAQAREYLERIYTTSNKMDAIINELLLLASVRQMDQIYVTPLLMGRFVGDALARFEPRIKEAQAEIILPKNWLTGVGYGPWVEEIWANYIGNALKYGGRPPQLKLGSTQLYPGGQVQFWVQDNGPGLDADQQAQVFNKFTRLHQERAEGHGLGLSIVQRIAEKLGGQVGVESQPGQGSRFYFTLPGAKEI